MFLKARLMTPGPTATAESTRLAMAAAAPHHRSPAFAALMKETLEGLRWLWDTEDDVLVLAGSGTTAMEAAMRSAIAPGHRVLVVTGGKFAERWETLAALLGAEVLSLPLAWGESASADALRARLAGEAPVDALVAVASETSTGALHPVPALVEALRAHSPDALAIVDGITAVGCVDLSMRRHGIDLLVSGSQKAFGLPPGAGFVGVSARAWDRIATVPPTSMALDLRAERKQSATGQSAFTPPIALIVGLHEVLGRWQTTGRDPLFAHADALAEMARAGGSAAGLHPFAAGLPSPALTSFHVPDGVDGAALVRRLREHWGISVAGGQDALKGRIVRVGHLGVVDPFDLLLTFAALEIALGELGATVRPGAAAAAIQPLIRARYGSAAPTHLNP